MKGFKGLLPLLTPAVYKRQHEHLIYSLCLCLQSSLVLCGVYTVHARFYTLQVKDNGPECLSRLGQWDCEKSDLTSYQ